MASRPPLPAPRILHKNWRRNPPRLAYANNCAHALPRFKEDIDRPLAAILTLNTIAHTAGAILVGSQATIIFGATSLDGGETIHVYGIGIEGTISDW